jgi:hypothetical protein
MVSAVCRSAVDVRRRLALLICRARPHDLDHVLVEASQGRTNTRAAHPQAISSRERQLALAARSFMVWIRLSASRFVPDPIRPPSVSPDQRDLSGSACRAVGDGTRVDPRVRRPRWPR